MIRLHIFFKRRDEKNERIVAVPIFCVHLSNDNGKWLLKSINQTVFRVRLAISHIPYHSIVRKFGIQTPSTNQIEPSAAARALFFDRSRTSGAVCVSLYNFLCTH